MTRLAPPNFKLSQSSCSLHFPLQLALLPLFCLLPPFFHLIHFLPFPLPLPFFLHILLVSHFPFPSFSSFTSSSSTSLPSSLPQTSPPPPPSFRYPLIRSPPTSPLPPVPPPSHPAGVQSQMFAAAHDGMQPNCKSNCKVGGLTRRPSFVRVARGKRSGRGQWDEDERGGEWPVY